jgi:GNAT superfamily N-acetyltransferase
MLVWTQGLARTGLFPVAGHHVIGLSRADAPVLQAFFDANPAYFEAVGGQPAGATEALQEFDDLPPPDMSFEQIVVIGCLAPSGELVAMATVVTKMIDPQVWHLGLFIVATALQGQGVAQRFYAGLEAWVRAAGAGWLRLGVVIGNNRAERFWTQQGFVAVRERGPVTLGQRSQRLRVMVKCLGQAGVDAYLGRVARDRPEDTL